MVARAWAAEPVGREEELARIDAFLTADAAVGRRLVLEGEAGIGKTTLWLAGVERAREYGFRVLVARPSEAELELSFATLGDLLADVHDRIHELRPAQRLPLEAALLLAETVGAPVEPRAVAVALLATLRLLAREQPLLVAVDDTQWVDASSATALSFALRRAMADVAVLFARRTRPDAESGVRLDATLGVERVVVGPMSLGALRRLVEDRLAASFARPALRRVHERSGGNPFFALELARALEARGGRLLPHEELPMSADLDRLVAERLRALPAAAREPLAAVAALGEPKRELLDTEALEPAFVAGVLVLDGERVRFEHPLLAAAAYSGLNPPLRRALHRRLADVVGDTEERARHLALGAEGPDAALAAVLDGAALRARVRGAPEAAADLAEWALRLGGDDDPDTASRRIVEAAECRLVAGDRGEARRLLDGALSSGAVGAARARLLLHRARFGDELVERAIGWLEEALGSVAGEPALEIEIRAWLVFRITNARRIADAEPHARRCLELAEKVGDPPLLVRALCALAQNQFCRGRGLPAELMERALELDPLCESLTVSDRPLCFFGFMCIWAGDLDGARTLLEEARRIGDDRADVTVQAVLWYTVMLEWLADEWPRALEVANELGELGTEIEYQPVIVDGLAGRALILAHLGDEAETRRAVAEAASLDAGDDSFNAVALRPWALGPLELSLDRPRAALDAIRPATADPRSKGIEEPALLLSFPIHAEAAIACGELEEAEELLDWIEERAVRLDREWALACIARCRGLLCAARGDETGAVAAFERALNEHDRVQGRRFELARTLLAHGETLRRFKKKRGARDAIEAAIAIFDELGAALWEAKARRELARVSGRTRADGLTEMERRVSTLVAAGRSNKEIASELFVTVRTVETHLTHVYAKLNVHSRTELVSRLWA